MNGKGQFVGNLPISTNFLILSLTTSLPLSPELVEGLSSVFMLPASSCLGELFHNRIVEQGSELFDSFVIPARMDAIGQQDHCHLLL